VHQQSAGADNGNHMQEYVHIHMPTAVSKDSYHLIQSITS